MTPFKCRIKRGVAVLTLTAAPPGNGLVREALAALTRAGCSHAALDLKGLAPDLALLKPLLALRRRLQKRSGRLVLYGLSRETEDWFRSTWLLSLFEVQPTLRHALASLAE